MRCMSVWMHCVRTGEGKKKRKKKKNTYYRMGMWTQRRGHVDGRIGVWTQMYCVRMRMSIKEKEKEKKDALCWLGW